MVFLKENLDFQLSKGQNVSIYGPERGPVGQIGYFLPGNPTIYRDAALELGEEEFIYDAPRLVGGGEILNLGDDTGGSAILLAQGLRDRWITGHVYTVDNYPKRMRKQSWYNREREGVNDLITLYNDTTDNVAEALKKQDRKFSFIFIDADHSYEGVRKDWLNFSEMLKPNGIISFHDTNQKCTMQVIEEEVDLSKWEMIFWVNRIKAFKKK